MISEYRTLVCEGPCNPTIVALDARVTAIREKETYGTGGYVAMPLPDAALVRELRALQHTTHAEVSEDRYACVRCGTVRQFGGNR